MLIRSRRVKNPLCARAFSIALLATVLVAAQTAGLGHRIEHAPWQGLLQQIQDCDDRSRRDHAHQVHDHECEGDHAPEHDCAAYDAATLGSGPPITQSQSAVASAPQPALIARVSAVVDNSPHLPFHPRAPPRA